jgi:hypothetical protein
MLLCLVFGGLVVPPPFLVSSHACDPIGFSVHSRCFRLDSVPLLLEVEVGSGLPLDRPSKPNGSAFVVFNFFDVSISPVEPWLFAVKNWLQAPWWCVSLEVLMKDVSGVSTHRCPSKFVSPWSQINEATFLVVNSLAPVNVLTACHFVIPM